MDTHEVPDNEPKSVKEENVRIGTYLTKIKAEDLRNLLRRNMKLSNSDVILPEKGAKLKRFIKNIMEEQDCRIRLHAESHRNAIESIGLTAEEVKCGRDKRKMEKIRELNELYENAIRRYSERVSVPRKERTVPIKVQPIGCTCEECSTKKKVPFWKEITKILKKHSEPPSQKASPQKASEASPQEGVQQDVDDYILNLESLRDIEEQFLADPDELVIPTGNGKYSSFFSPFRVRLCDGGRRTDTNPYRCANHPAQ